MGISIKQPILRKSILVLFWMIITLIFIYDRRYLIIKFQLQEHFVACVIFRIGLLISLVYVHHHFLIPKFFKTTKFLKYGIFLFAALIVYVSLQNLYDIYLYGFVIGDVRSRDFWNSFPYNFIITSWYLTLAAILQFGLDKYEQKKGEPSYSKNSEKDEGIDRQVFLKSGTKQVMTDLDTVTHVKGLKDYSIVFTDEEQIIVKGSLKNAENLLGDKKLIRVHKSYLVALDRIKTIQHNQIILGNHSIPIGRSYKKELFEVLEIG